MGTFKASGKAINAEQEVTEWKNIWDKCEAKNEAQWENDAK